MKTFDYDPSTIFTFFFLNRILPDNFYLDDFTASILNGPCSDPQKQIFVLADNRLDPTNLFFPALKASFNLAAAGCLIPFFPTNN